MYARGFKGAGESMILEQGRVCLKIAGREGGKYCVIVEKINDNFVLITGPKSITQVKRRKCNIDHLEPTPEKFDIGNGDDSTIEKVWKDSGLIEKFKIKTPVKKAKKEKPKEIEKKKAK